MVSVPSKFSPPAKIVWTFQAQCENAEKFFITYVRFQCDLQKKKKRSSRPWRHPSLCWSPKRKGPSSEFCNFSPWFVRHTRARRREPQLPTVFGGKRNFFFYHGFADLLRHILCPNLEFRTPLSILTWSALFTGNLIRWYILGKVRLDMSFW